MSQTYSFPISGTSNQKVNPGVLAQQIEDAGFATGGAFEGVAVDGGKSAGRGLLDGVGTIEVTWASALDPAETTAQAALVAGHVGEAFARALARKLAIPLQSNPNAAFQSVFAAPLSVGPLERGIWQVSFYCEMKLQAAPASSADNCQVKIEDEAGSDIVNTRTYQDDWIAVSGQRTFDYDAGKMLALDMLFRRNGAGMVADIRRCQIVLELLRSAS